ncbi:MAG: nickel pincer cofactor biosynthesis protein LarB [Candidatus Coatesbacteria bacterium]
MRAPRDVLAVLRDVRRGRLSARAALGRLRWLPFEDMGFARLDFHRELRTRSPEVVFCEGKSLGQSEAVIRSLVRRSGRALATRAPEALADRLRGAGLRVAYDRDSRVLVAGKAVPAPAHGLVGVLCAGTSDIPVAEEAARTAEFLGVRVQRHYDAGVAGLHRLFAARKLLGAADALVVAAGMEGALPSVVGGLTDRPVVAVPTSVGYGASYRGLAALLAMMNACAPGIAVVNIDNGFGAGYYAAMIARRTRSR